ncbi:unnamed protein product [Brugia timori]|uniref:Uncharacterized protein n=1 Tax=Brugia timori TaxID=42155 RepID=A0A0R3R114_9BILA|nr:unnamed protein product [Brugia timori]
MESEKQSPKCHLHLYLLSYQLFPFFASLFIIHCFCNSLHCFPLF